MKKPSFSIQYLDHIAIRARDIEASARWYEEVLGLTRVQPEEWKPWPIFMLAGDSGIAIFPEKEDRYIKPDHYAFRVDRLAYDSAKDHLSTLNISFEEQDHTYFLSIYFRDPDDHTVELTTLIKPL